MKKILSLAMAIVMMMAIAVPAFAAIDKDTAYEDDGVSQAGTAVVATTFDTDDISYSIEIPATINIAWNTAKDDVAENNAGYTVTSSLATGDTLSITVAKNDEGKMYLESDTAKTGANLVFDIEGDLEAKTYEGYNAAVAGPALKAYVTDWSGVPMDAYLGTITYTVVYTAA